MLNSINTIILILVLILVSIFDIKYKKIPNYLTFPVILWGLISAVVVNGLKGLQLSATGFGFGIAIFLIPFALCMIGGGDVKLMGAIGALMGWKFSLSAVLYGSLVGGIIAIFLLLFNKNFITILFKLISNLLKPFLRYLYNKTGNVTFLKKLEYFDSKKISYKKKYLPYGAAIAAGTLLVLIGVVPKVIS